MEFIQKLIKKLEPLPVSAESLRDKCEAELEVRYTACLTMEDVIAWNKANLLPGTSAILALMETQSKLPSGIRYLRNSIIMDANRHACKDRMIYAMEVEPSLLAQMENGNGYIYFKQK